MTALVLTRLWRRLGAVWRAVSPAERTDGDPAGAGGTCLPDGGQPGRPDAGRRSGEAEHLRDVPDGAGCSEIWEHLSERQAPEAEADD